MKSPARAIALLSLSLTGCSAPDGPPIPVVRPAAAGTSTAGPAGAGPATGEAAETVAAEARAISPVADEAEARPASEAVPASGAAGTAPEKRRYVVAAMGDSLTDPKSHGGKYLDYLARQCPESRFDSYGKGGNMVNQMRRRFLRDVFGESEGGARLDRPRYTHVIVLGGLNDILSDESALRTNDQIKDDLAWMYQAAKARGAAVIALTLPPWAGFEKWYNPRRGASTEEINRWIKQQHQAGTVDAMFDVYPVMSCGDPDFLCPKYGWPDQVHWSAAGHDAVGRALHEHLFADCR